VAFLRRVLANKTTLPESYVAIIQAFLQRVRIRARFPIPTYSTLLLMFLRHAEQIDHLQKPMAKFHTRFEHEYYELCSSIDDAPWFAAAITPQTKHTLAKNRYRDVLPFERTRVKLACAPPHDYINANYIDEAYIACQAPVRNAIRDFWHMLWETNVAVVLMLTNFVERERIKADLYWDAQRGPVDFDGVVAQLLSEEVDAGHGFLVRKFHVWKTSASRATQPPRVVLHVQLTTWPDHGVLRDFRVVAPMLELVNNFRDRAASEQRLSQARMVVHCSAGIGRSGTFITIDVILKRLHEAFAAQSVADGERLLREALDVRAIVHGIRSQRPGMVQTPVRILQTLGEAIDVLILTRWCLWTMQEQYEMVYRYVAAVLTNQQPW
jgi:protein tyrosine phosphatase